jgi:uncharacterized protein (TIGR01777 family)
MNVLVTGATGLVGTALASRLKAKGHRVVPVRRAAGGGETEATWNPESRQVQLPADAVFDAVVHLAGESIAQRWTSSARARIRASRVDATRLLSEALAARPVPPRVLICASATGFYGDRGDELLNEDSASGSGFLAELCQAWEAAATPARQRGIRVVHLRFGLVLADHGGALARMLPVFRLGLGGRLGSGRQYWSWITLEDALGVVEWVLHDDQVTGAVNTVSPEMITNARFTAALARALHRPACLPVPAFVVRAAFGEMGREALLASARVRPARLLRAGFRFQLPDLDVALSHLLAANQGHPAGSCPS